MNVREKLIEIQKRDKLTDLQMAKLLNIHPVSWNRVKNGGNLSEKVKKRAVAVWPADLANLYLKEALESK